MTERIRNVVGDGAVMAGKCCFPTCKKTFAGHMPRGWQNMTGWLDVIQLQTGEPVEKLLCPKHNQKLKVIVRRAYAESGGSPQATCDALIAALKPDRDVAAARQHGELVIRKPQGSA
jgi:hypothetical protein